MRCRWLAMAIDSVDAPVRKVIQTRLRSRLDPNRRIRRCRKQVNPLKIEAQSAVCEHEENWLRRGVDVSSLAKPSCRSIPVTLRCRLNKIESERRHSRLKKLPNLLPTNPRSNHSNFAKRLSGYESRKKAALGDDRHAVASRGGCQRCGDARCVATVDGISGDSTKRISGISVLPSPMEGGRETHSGATRISASAYWRRTPWPRGVAPSATQLES